MSEAGLTRLDGMEMKIFGAFRSGTNFTKALLEINYDAWVRTRNGGFKHAPVPAVFVGSAEWMRPKDPVVGVVKDPWSWLPSMWTYVSGPGSLRTRAQIVCAVLEASCLVRASPRRRLSRGGP